jgi:hypothetical protein
MIKKVLAQFFKKIKNFIFPPLEVEVIKGWGKDIEENFYEFLKDNFDNILKVKVYYGQAAFIVIKGVKDRRKNKVYVLWKFFYENTERFKNVIRKHSPNAKIVFI